MQRQTHVDNGRAVNHIVADAAEKALGVMQMGASKAAVSTEKMVRRYPLASLGIALGSGLLVGVIGYRLMRNRHLDTEIKRSKESREAGR